jgi:hypothetical protein
MITNFSMTPCSSAFDIKRNHPKYEYSTFDFSKINIKYEIKDISYWFFPNNTYENVKKLEIICYVDFFENHKFKGSKKGQTFFIFSCEIKEEEIKEIKESDYNELYNEIICTCAEYLNEGFKKKIDPKSINILEYNTPISDSKPNFFKLII